MFEHMRIWKDFHFDAAHYLPNVEEGHKCKRLHGHTYKLRVWCSGSAKKHRREQVESGWVMDFAEIERAVLPVISCLDHHVLNDIEGLENPTVEHVAKWITERLVTANLWRLVRIEVQEGQSAGVVLECVQGYWADQRLEKLKVETLKGGQGVPIRITSESIESSAEISQLEQDRDEWKARAEKAELEVKVSDVLIADFRALCCEAADVWESNNAIKLEPEEKMLQRLRRAGEGEP